MSLQINLANLATRIATEIKSVRAGIGAMTDLSTQTKSSLVAAINELDVAVKAVALGSGAIADGSTSGTSTWSSSRTAAAIAAQISDVAGAGNVTKTWSADRIVGAIAAAKSEILQGAGPALDTLQELAAALGNDPGFATTITNALAKRIRVDQAQSFSPSERLQACQNIGVGDPETDFVTVFNAGLA